MFRATVLFVCFLLCACASTKMPATLKPSPPRVDCAQGANPDLSAAPRSDEWIVCTPVLGKQEECTLSEKAALWVVEAVSLLRLERTVRKQEHMCIDKLIEKKIITK